MPNQKGVNRRQAMKGVAAGLGAAASLPILNQSTMAQGHHHGALVSPAASTAAAKAPTFFSPQQYEVITELASLIIPTDETPGAREAKVNEYIDLIVSEGTATAKKLYRDGLEWLEKTSQSRYGKKFIQLSHDQQVEILTEISQIKDSTPANQLQARFFKAIKQDTIDGFYTSKIGLEELGYKGNTVLDVFPGCTHPEHQS
ncbi:MAG: gluconate 2-dehydrogenase subunit 3 family protein [Terriglobia bacterium]